MVEPQKPDATDRSTLCSRRRRLLTAKFLRQRGGGGRPLHAKFTFGVLHLRASPCVMAAARSNMMVDNRNNRSPVFRV